MFDLDEKIMLLELIELKIKIESANLRNQGTVKFSNNKTVFKAQKALTTLNLIKAKLESL